MLTQDKVLKVILWTARIMGSLFLAFVLFFLIAHIFGEDETGEGFQSTAEVIMFICFPISTVIGLALALKWEGLGGVIVLIGMTGLLAMRPDLLSNPYFIIPFVPGILYISYWLITRLRYKYK